MHKSLLLISIVLITRILLISSCFTDEFYARDVLGEQIETKLEEDKNSTYTKISRPRCKVNISNRQEVNTSYGVECFNRTFGQRNSTWYYLQLEERRKIIRNNVRCYVQCLAQKYKWVNNDGVILLDEYVHQMSTIYNGTWVAPLAKVIALKCYKTVQKQSLDFLGNRTEDSCNPALITFNSCIRNEIEINCPPEEIL